MWRLVKDKEEGGREEGREGEFITQDSFNHWTMLSWISKHTNHVGAEKCCPSRFSCSERSDGQRVSHKDIRFRLVEKKS